MKRFELNQEKFDNLVHYVIATCPDPAKLGSTKLQKILWKSDTRLYATQQQSITGATYQKREFGPATNELWLSQDRLQNQGRIRHWRDKGFSGGYQKQVYQNLVPADPSFLSHEERQAVDYWIKEICLNHTAESISEETHGYAWEIAEMGEEMPLASVFVDDLPEEMSEEARAWSREEVERLGLSGL